MTQFMKWWTDKVKGPALSPKQFKAVQPKMKQTEYKFRNNLNDWKLTIKAENPERAKMILANMDLQLPKHVKWSLQI